MRTPINRLVVTFVVAGPTGVLAAQELTLPRQELTDAIKAANDARIHELTAELKAAQKSIAGGGEGSGVNRRDAIIAARERESAIGVNEVRRMCDRGEIQATNVARRKLGGAVAN